jgi:deoxyribose-phosphate aldolase
MSSLDKNLVEQIVLEVLEKYQSLQPATDHQHNGDHCVHCSPASELTVKNGRELVDHGASRIGVPTKSCPAKYELARWIDHTLLKPDATYGEVEQLCAEAAENNFASVCINPTHVARAKKILRASKVKVCTVIGFPLGATLPEVKAAETRAAIENGAEEIDMVINVGALKSGDYDLVAKDIRAVVRAARRRVVKVILETCLLNDAEKVKACMLSQEAGADFVKTSTGFSKGGATVRDVALMREVVGTKMGVKASGGVRNYEDACKMIESGATRIGASASVAIVGKATAESKGY